MFKQRYERCFKGKDFGKFRNCFYDLINFMFGISPKYIFKYGIGEFLNKE